MGYHRAGFDVVGVDIKPQPHYPFEFVQASWDEALAYLPGLWEREPVDYMVHASPPCQHYSTMTKRWGREDEHPDLVAAVQYALRCLGDESEQMVPYVIENVMGARLDDPMMLCGTMFGLQSQGYGLQRHRQFESNVWLFPPAMCHHHLPALPVYGHAGGSSKRDGLKFPGTDRLAKLSDPVKPTETGRFIVPRDAFVRWYTWMGLDADELDEMYGEES